MSNTMYNKTIVVNLIAPPSAGKSSIMGDVFGKLKWAGVDCEIAPEFAKDLVWEGRQDSLSDQLYVFAKQAHRLYRLNHKVQVIVTDSPVLLSILYNNKYHEKSTNLNNLILETYNKYDNLNFFIRRVKKYNPNGRNQTEQESDEIGLELKGLLTENSLPYEIVDGTPTGACVIFDRIMKELNN